MMGWRLKQPVCPPCGNTHTFTGNRGRGDAIESIVVLVQALQVSCFKKLNLLDITSNLLFRLPSGTDDYGNKKHFLMA